jgi:hypothetical protein
MKTTSIIYAPYQGTYENDEFIDYERAKKYIRNWNEWEKCFPTHVILWLVNEKIRMRDVCAIHYIPVSCNNNYFASRYERLPEIKKSFRFTEERGEWYRDHYEDAYQYIVPAQGQNVRLGKAFKEAIYMAFPYLKEYDFNAYVPDCNPFCEIYINMRYKLENKYVNTTLYCPIEALLKKDADIIYQRHYSYNSNYYKNQPEHSKVVLGVLKSQKYKVFCKKVKGE